MTYELWWKTICIELDLPQTSNLREVREAIAYLISEAQKNGVSRPSSEKEF